MALELPSGDSRLDIEIFAYDRGRAVGGAVVLLEQSGELVAKSARALRIGRPERRDRRPVARGEELGHGGGWKREAQLQGSTGAAQ